MAEYEVTSNLSDVISRIFFMSKRNKIAIRPMKLQKLLFFSYGWYAGKTKNKLFIENFEAWPYGPVIPQVYYRYRSWGASEISIKGKKIDLGDEKANYMVDSAVEAYGISTDVGLSNITHEKGSPWNKVWQEDNASASDLRSIIPFASIRDFYKAKLQAG